MTANKKVTNIKLIKDGKSPIKDPKDKCYDLFTRKIERGSDGAVPIVKVYTGVAIQPPEGFSTKLHPRSSIGTKGNSWFLANGTGIIDNPYTGEIIGVFKSTVNTIKEYSDGRSEVVTPLEFPYKKGDRALQLEMVRDYEMDLQYVDDLNNTKRGSEGFGSTGR